MNNLQEMAKRIAQKNRELYEEVQILWKAVNEAYGNTPVQGSSNASSNNRSTSKRYTCAIEDVRRTHSKSGKELIRWRMRVTGPSDTGRTIYQNTMIGGADNNGFLNANLRKLGLDDSFVPDFGNPAINRRIVGRTVEVVCEDQPGGMHSARIERVID